MTSTFYHVLLRVSALTLSLVLLFESGLLSPTTKQLSLDTHAYLEAAVGMSAGVTPTKLNTVTAQLTQKKQELDKREQAVQQREIAVGIRGGKTSQNSSLPTFVMSILLFVLLVLIVLNYVLDYLRSKQVILQQAHE